MTMISHSDEEHRIKDEYGRVHSIHFYPKDFIEQSVFRNDRDLLLNLGAVICTKESLHRKFIKRNSQPVYTTYCGRYGIGFTCDMENPKSANYCIRRYYTFKKPIEDGIFLLYNRRIASSEARSKVRFFSDFVSEHNYMYAEFLFDGVFSAEKVFVQAYNLAAFTSEKLS